jgi:hypothetical protein
MPCVLTEFRARKGLTFRLPCPLYVYFDHCVLYRFKAAPKSRFSIRKLGIIALKLCVACVAFHVAGQYF